MAAITARQSLFAQEFLVDLNATQAAIRAGYSPNTANEQAVRLMAKPEVKAEVERLQAQSANTLQISRERVLLELSKIAFSDIKKLYQTNQRKFVYKSVSDIPDEFWPAISAIKITPSEWGDSIHITLHNKIGALEMLGRHLGLFEADNAQKQAITINVIGRIPERARETIDISPDA